jgi:hypothetical protein
MLFLNRSLLGVLILLLEFGASGQLRTLNNKQIIQMLGQSEDTILLMIKGTKGNYSLGPDDLAQLKEAGVSDRVIRAMTEKMAGGNSLKEDLRVPEPEREGVYYFFDEATNQLEPLSSEMGMLKGKAKVGGLAGAKTVLELNGERSPTQLKASDHFAFLLRVRGGSTALNFSTDAALQQMAGQLYAFASKKGKREKTEFDVKWYGITGRSSAKTGSDASVTVTRATGNILKITIQALPPGEYAFTAGGGMIQCYSFAILP